MGGRIVLGQQMDRRKGDSMTPPRRMATSKSSRAALMAAILLAVHLGPASADGPEWNDAMRAAEKAFGESRYAEAERSLRIAVMEAEKFGPDDGRLATSLSTLGVALYSQGKYAEAEQLYLRAVGILEKTYGRGHLRMADGLTDLAGLYNMQRKYAEAEPLLNLALSIREKILGPDHPDVAHSLNNLGTFYNSQGKFTQAETFYQRALSIQEKV